MYLYQVSYHLFVSVTLSLTGISYPTKYLSQVFLSATPLQLLNFSSLNHVLISYSYPLLLSPYYTVASQTAHPSYSFQLFVSAKVSVTLSFSYQLLLSATRNG